MKILLHTLLLLLLTTACEWSKPEAPSPETQFQAWLSSLSAEELKAAGLFSESPNPGFIAIMKSEPLCATIDCDRSFELLGKEAVVYTMEDLFMRGIPPNRALHVGVSENEGWLTFAYGG